MVMAFYSLLFTINAHTFHITSYSPMHLYSPLLLGMSTIVVHASASGMFTSLNANFVTLTSLSQSYVSRYFPLVASLSHTF